MTDLRKNSLWSLASICSYSIAQFWILSFMARMGDIDQIGFYSLALSVTTPLIVFSNLNLRYIYVTDNSVNYQIQDYYRLRLIVSLFVFVAVMILNYFLKYNLLVKFLIIIVTFYKILETLSDLSFAIHQKRQQMHLISRSIFFRSFLILLTFTISFYLSRDILVSSIFILVSYFFSFVIFDYPIIKNVENNSFDLFNIQNVNLESLKKIFLLGFPMGVSLFIYSLFVNVPRFFIEEYLGVEDLGIYSALYYLYSSTLLITIAFTDAALPHFTIYEQRNDHYLFKKLLYKYINLAIFFVSFFSIIIWLSDGFFLRVAFGNSFSSKNDIFLIGFLITGIEILNKIVSTALIAKRKFKIQPYINFLSLVVLIFLFILFRESLSLIKVLYFQAIALSLQLLMFCIVFFRGTPFIRP
jgi:O-antigen/teichoic acid export membrane protein